MRVLYIINNINRGGAETLLLNIIKGLKKTDLGFETRVLLLEDEQYLRPLFDEAGIEVECAHCKELPFLKQVLHLRRYIKKYRPDVVHTHLLESDRVGLLAAFLSGVKKRVCTIHNMEPNRDRRDRITRVVTSLFATQLIAVSESAKQFGLENKLYPESKMEVLYNAAGFVEKNIALKKYPAGTFQIVNVARLHRQKGHKYLLEAMAILQEKGIDAHLTVYGTGAEFDALNAIIKARKLKNTTLFGITDDVPTVLRNANLFVAPSLWEGLPLSQIEAVMMGVPVVATSIEPHKEIFNFNGQYQYLSSPEDACGLAEKMMDVIAMSPEEYEALSNQMIGLSERFSMDAMIANYYNFYRRLQNV